MMMTIDIFPPEIIEQYKLWELEHNGNIYIQISKGMYGLPQAELLAHNQLVDFMEPSGYYPFRNTPDLWSHKWRPVIFTLVVDDFGIKYVVCHHIIHLLDALKSHYTKVTVDWTGSRYCGIDIKCDYVNKSSQLSIPNYIPDTLHKYQHPRPLKSTHDPYPCPSPQFGKEVQLPLPLDQSELESPEDKKFIQRVVGTFLYFA